MLANYTLSTYNLSFEDTATLAPAVISFKKIGAAEIIKLSSALG